MSVELHSDEIKNLRVKILKAHDLLQNKYGTQTHNGKISPLDELVRTILSHNTTEAHSNSIFDQLRKKFKSWETVMVATPQKISEAMKDGHISYAKVLRLKRILRRIYKDRGNLSLDFLKDMDCKEGMKYLLSIKGIGSQTACGVLLFSLKKPVIPVNAHVERVSKRLGWVWNHASVEDVQNVLNSVIPRYLVTGLHSQLNKLGRMICKSKNPYCTKCVVHHDCVFSRQKSVKR